jgi:hypothetical protein
LAVHCEHHVDATDSPSAFIRRCDKVTDNLSKSAVGNGPVVDDADMVRCVTTRPLRKTIRGATNCSSPFAPDSRNVKVSVVVRASGETALQLREVPIPR